MAIYLKIKRLIEEDKFLQQKDLADALGVTSKTAHNYLNGHTKITADQIPSIVKLLGITLEELYKEGSYSKKIKPSVNSEPKIEYRCVDCLAKQKEIDALIKALDAKDELLEMYRGKRGEATVDGD